MKSSDFERGINFAAVRAAVDSGLVWLQTDPVRGMRNLLDLGSYFARTHRQSEFFQTARRLLGSRRSQYMRLVERALTGVDLDVLKTLGINLGYFSWSLGARAICELEAACDVFVPWSFMFRLDSAQLNALKSHEIRTALEQARRLGAHSFWFNVRGSRDYVAMLLQLFGAFKDCAFMLMLNGTQLTRELTQLARAQLNTMICIDQSSARDDHATAMLREARLLFGLSLTYDDSNANTALDGTLLETVERRGGHFALLLRGAQCTECCWLKVHKYAVDARMSPARPAFMVDVFDDMAQVDRNISSRACFVEIGPDGSVANRPWSQTGRLSLRRSSLWDILNDLTSGNK